MITLKDIAQRCGVSTAAVSKALNHMPGVSAQKAEEIRRAARRMGYLPNAAARILKTKRSFNIGVLLEDDDHRGLLHDFFVAVLESFKGAMEKHGYDLMLLNRTVGRRRVSYLEHCYHDNLDGVFVACIDFGDPELIELAAAPIPLVTIDHSYPHRPSVFSNNEDGMMQAVKYAHSLGHRRIAFICGAEAGVTSRRLAGYLAALEDLGVAPREDYLLYSRYRDIRQTGEAAQRLLRLDEPPTCILMPDDYAALGGIQAISGLGLRVPEDVSVIGFDGLPIVQHMLPRLTTVRQDTVRLGETAAALLMKSIDTHRGGRPLTDGRVTLVPATLIEGETVAPLSPR